MEARDANRIVSRAKRKGWTPEMIAARLYCSTQTLRDWEARPETKVSRALEANLRALLEELRAKGGKK